MRRTAVQVLCDLAPNPEAAVEVIAEAFDDSAIGRGRWWTWWIAWRSGIVLPIDMCVRGLRSDTHPKERVFAGWLMLRHGDVGRQALERFMRTGSPDERATAAVALSSPGDEEAFAILVRELVSGRRHKRWIGIVAHTLVRNYSDRIEELVESREIDVAEHPGLAWAVAKSRIARGYATDDELLRYGIPSVRAAFVRKIAKQRAEAFLPQLREFLREGKPRKVAQEAFWQMHRLKDAARPIVEDMLHSEHWTERKAAVCLLRRWGELTADAKRQAEHDAHVAVQHAAA